MAKFEIKFFDCVDKTNISVLKDNPDSDFINENYINGIISIIIEDDLHSNVIYLDKSTAIKFAKTLRTEINKITESEVNNG